MEADDIEDYLELRDPEVKAQICESKLDVLCGRVKPAEALLEELKAAAKSKRC